MKAELCGHHINLRGESEEEREILREMYKHGIRVWGGGSYLSFSTKELIDNNEKKLRMLYESYKNLESVPIPFNLHKHITPVWDWLESEFTTDCELASDTGEC